MYFTSKAGFEVTHENFDYLSNFPLMEQLVGFGLSNSSWRVLANQ